MNLVRLSDVRGEPRPVDRALHARHREDPELGLVVNVGKDLVLVLEAVERGKGPRLK